jgi:zinc transporter ZupT
VSLRVAVTPSGLLSGLAGALETAALGLAAALTAGLLVVPLVPELHPAMREKSMANARRTARILTLFFMVSPPRKIL